MSTNYAPGQPGDDDPRPDGAEVVPFPARTPADDDAAPAALSDTSYEVELDDDPDADPGAVDDGIGFVLDDDPDAYPVIPEHLRSLAGVGGALARHGRRLGHRGAFHGVRSPLYLILALWWAVVGVFRLAERQLSWWWVTETDLLRSAAVANQDAREWMRLHKEAKETRLIRGIVLAAEAAGLMLAGGLLLAFAPWWARLAVAVVAVPMLARAGRPDDRPIIASATTEPRFRVISADVVLRAYYAAGLGNPDKDGQRIGFESRMERDGEGSRVRVVLPYGTGFHDVVKSLPALASGLDVAPSQVYLTADKTSHRRHTLWVADRDPLAIPAGRTPLLDCKPRSIWRAAPVGLDERGRPVTLLLLWISILIGAQPRKGKTFAGRLLALYAALDASVRISIVDGKNSPDWTGFKQIAYHYIRGIVPNGDGDPVAQLKDALAEIKRHIIDTNDFLASLDVRECPEGKLTEELCRKYPKRLFVWVLVMEEFQNYFELPDQKANQAIAELLSFIMAVGPSAGVIIESLSQKPSGVGAGDVQRLFNRYRDNHAVRLALKCGNRNVSVAILSDDAYAEGHDASALPNESKGVGILYGASDETPTVRIHLADHADAAKILAAARVIRERAGTITGYAAGVESDAAAADILADARAVFGADNGLHWDVLAERLARAYPQRYADATAESVSAACRARGVPSVDVRFPAGRAGAVRKGCRRADLEGADGAR
jgi:S-DNA-T family DNA segregation ATPase FtsK/SpoIIIE